MKIKLYAAGLTLVSLAGLAGIVIHPRYIGG